MNTDEHGWKEEGWKRDGRGMEEGEGRTEGHEERAVWWKQTDMKCEREHGGHYTEMGVFFKGSCEHVYRLRGRKGQEVRFQLSAVSGRATGQRLQVTAVRSPVSAFLASGL